MEFRQGKKLRSSKIIRLSAGQITSTDPGQLLPGQHAHNSPSTNPAELNNLLWMIGGD